MPKTIINILPINLKSMLIAILKIYNFLILFIKHWPKKM